MITDPAQAVETLRALLPATFTDLRVEQVGSVSRLVDDLTAQRVNLLKTDHRIFLRHDGTPEDAPLSEVILADEQAERDRISAQLEATDRALRSISEWIAESGLKPPPSP